MTKQLKDMKVAIVVDDLFEQAELAEPKKALEAAGVTVHIVAPKGPAVTGMKHHDKGDTFPVSVSLDQARPEDYDGLVLPGGVVNADVLRMNEDAQRFARSFFEAGKPVASICHGPWTLVEADVVRGRTLTSWPSLQTDIRNAGGTWVDEEVHVDQGLVTSRKPDDIPAFNEKMLEEFAEGKHSGQRVTADATAS